METTNIYQKLVEIQEATGEIVKGELNKFNNYKYFTESQALRIIKPLLKKHGLALYFSDTASDFYHEKDGKDHTVRYLKQAYLADTTSEARLIFNFWAIGNNSDPAKAKGSAETYAIKYFLTKFFLIPTTDEDDPDKPTKKEENITTHNLKADGNQETKEEIRKRNRAKELNEIVKKHGLDYQKTADYQQFIARYGSN